MDEQVPSGAEGTGPRALTVPERDAVLEVECFGAGEPVVVIQTALSADELLPLAAALGRSGDLWAVHLHRRGYAGSSAALPGVTMSDLAADVRAAIDALGIAPAHVVGVSFSAAIALTLAVTSPQHVRTVTLVEPPPVGGPGAVAFRAANAALAGTFETQGAEAALEQLMPMIAGEHWREVVEAEDPGAVAAMERDAEAFFSADVPALMSWEPDADEVGRIRCPVLTVGGEQSGPWFADARAQLRQWLPQLEQATVREAGHLVGTTHAEHVAGLLTGFMRRHPLAPHPR